MSRLKQDHFWFPSLALDINLQPVLVTMSAFTKGATPPAATSPASPDGSPSCTTADYVIVGAGMSGLAAAAYFIKHGRSVVILEARRRVGGRVLTTTLPTASEVGSDTICELGAHWIHGVDGNAAVPFIRDDSGLSLYPTFDEDVFLSGGSGATREVPKAMLKAAFADKQLEEEELYTLCGDDDDDDDSDSSSSDSDDSSSSDSEGSSKGKQRADVSVAEGLRQVRRVRRAGQNPALGEAGVAQTETGLRARVLDWVWAREELDCGLALEKIGLAAWMEEPYQTGSGESLVIGGVQRIPNAMADKLPANCVRLGHEVTSIDTTGAAAAASPTATEADETTSAARSVSTAATVTAIVTTPTGEEHKAFYARHGVLCTLPIGVLKMHQERADAADAADAAEAAAAAGGDTAGASSSLFSPPLCAASATAIRTLKNGHLQRVVLAFREPFWESAGVTHDFIGVVPPRDGDFEARAWPRQFVIVPPGAACLANGGGTSTLTATPAEKGALEEETKEGTSSGSCAASRGAFVLVAEIGGGDETEAQAMSDADVVETCLSTLRRALPLDVPQPIAFAVSRWDKDRFSLGSYSGLPIGASPLTPKPLCSPHSDGRLFFAGEATAPAGLRGTIHGAMRSGKRQARAMINGEAGGAKAAGDATSVPALGGESESGEDSKSEEDSGPGKNT